MGKSLDERFRCREQTYRSHEAARRSFFRFVAKERLYYPLRWLKWFGTWDWQRKPERGFGTGCYSQGGYGPEGMPVFRNWRSATYDVWDGKFQEHRERWKEESYAKWRVAWLAHFGADRREALHASPAVRVFQFLAAASEL